jgi:hypothetical protein
VKPPLFITTALGSVALSLSVTAAWAQGVPVPPPATASEAPAAKTETRAATTETRAAGATTRETTEAAGSLETSLPEDARANYESAMWLWEAADYNGALLKFQLVYARSGDPRLLWNLAVCEKALRHYAKALPLVRRYLDEAGAKLTDAERQEATDFATTIEGFVGPVRIESDQASAKLFVDGEEVGKTPLKEPLLLDMGDHKLTLRKHGFKEISATVRVLGPESRDRVFLAMERDIPAATLEVRAGRGQWISVDDSEVGRDRWEGLVSPGRHRIRVTGVDCKPQDVEADLSNGGHTSVWVTARPLLPSEKGYLWPLVGVLAGVTGVIGVVSYYALKPHDTRNSPKELGTLDTIEVGLVRGGN